MLLTLRKKFPELGILAGIAAGAGLAYFADPYRGRRRRAQARNKVTHLANTAEKAIDRSFRDLTNRAHGLFAEALRQFDQRKSGTVTNVQNSEAVLHSDAVE